MTLKQLEYFVALSKNSHFSNVASQLYISQSTLSYAISELEQDLDVKLTERRGRRTYLTKAGQEYAAAIEPILAQLKDVNSRIKESSGGSFEVLLGIFPTLYNDFANELINGFYNAGAAHNNIEIVLYDQKNDTELLSKLENHQIDLSFCALPKANMKQVPLFKQQFYLFVSPQHLLADRSSVSFCDLCELEYIDLAKTSSSRQLVDNIFRSNSKNRNVIKEQYSYHAVISYVSNNFGAAILPYARWYDPGIVRSVPIDGREFQRIIYLAWMDDNELSSAVKRVKDFLIDNSANIYANSCNNEGVNRPSIQN